MRETSYLNRHVFKNYSVSSKCSLMLPINITDPLRRIDKVEPKTRLRSRTLKRLLHQFVALSTTDFCNFLSRKPIIIHCINS